MSQPGCEEEQEGSRETTQGKGAGGLAEEGEGSGSAGPEDVEGGDHGTRNAGRGPGPHP